MLVIFFVLSTRNSCLPHYPVFPLEDLFGVSGIPLFHILCLVQHGCIEYPSMRVLRSHLIYGCTEKFPIISCGLLY
jgi:hypothetical protein